ncbi:MAG TPA: DMT family transporter [Thermoplasmata archaeon]|nr:DMT family transporter [Thermoplasmata archaeon]
MAANPEVVAPRRVPTAGFDLRLWAAATAAILAAFLWATYYSFVLGAPGTPPSGLLVDPFLAGAAGFLVLAGVRREIRSVGPLFRDPRSWARASLLVAMQVSVLASTYLTGAVDTSLLSLVGDVVLTPIALVLLYGEGRERFRTPLFGLGLVTATAGATLVIVAGASVEALSGWAWVAAPIVPVAVALYFLYTARANRETPMTALVGQGTLLAGVLGILVSPALPGGLGGLWPASWGSAGVVIAIGLTSFFLGPYLYFRAIESVGIVLPAVLMTAIPVFTLALNVALFHEAPPWLGLAGIPIAVIGSLVALRGPHSGWGSPEASGAG